MNPNKTSKNILIVEDEFDIRQLMRLHLNREGRLTTEADNGAKAYEILEKNSFDLIILDWMLPGMSGLELLQWMRAKTKTHRTTPVLFVTAKSEPDNIVLALESGADDYIVKPFDFKVFIARTSALLRRQSLENFFNAQTKEKDILTIGDLKLNRGAHKVFLKDKEIYLTLSEFLLLEALLMNQGKALSRRQLANYVQGEDVVVTRRTIDTHTAVLRKKIGSYGKLIETVRGIGYRIGYIDENTNS